MLTLLPPLRTIYCNQLVVLFQYIERRIMGGKEGGRGYLYQGIVAVLEALRRNDWDRIYIEFPTEGDKVDIALKSADTITDAIQVKSTVNSFSKGDISKWLKDIITDYAKRR